MYIFKEFNVAQLKQVVKYYNLHTVIKGYSKMKKDDLISHLSNHLSPIGENKVETKSKTIKIDDIPKPNKRSYKKKVSDKVKETIPETNETIALTINDFKSKEFLQEAIDLYYRNKGQKLTNLSKMNFDRLQSIIEKRNIKLTDLKEFYNKAIDNKFYYYNDSTSPKIEKLKKKWKTLYII